MSSGRAEYRNKYDIIQVNVEYLTWTMIKETEINTSFKDPLIILQNKKSIYSKSIIIQLTVLLEYIDLFSYMNLNYSSASTFNFF